MHTSALVLNVDKALGSPRPRRKSDTKSIATSALLLGYVLVLLVAVCSELAVVWGIGTGIRMIFHDLSIQRPAAVSFRR